MIEGRILQEKSDGINTLPIFFPPPVVTYLGFPFQLAIILANEKAKGWFFSNYIQLFSKLDANPMHLFIFYPEVCTNIRDQFFIEVTGLNNDIFPVDKSNLSSNICKWMDKDYYVSLILSEAELPGTALYQTKLRGPHEQFLFGYHLSHRTFKLLNFNNSRIFSSINIPFEDLEKAYFSEGSKKAQDLFFSWGTTSCPIHLYKYRNCESVRYDFDVNVVYHLLSDYLNARDSSFYHNKLLYPKITEFQGGCWGVGIYSSLITYLASAEKADFFDFRAFHGLWEHKKIMTARLEYLEELKYLNREKGCAKKYSEIEEEVNKLRLMALRHSVKKDTNLINKIIDKLRLVVCMEQEILTDVCENLIK